MEEIDLQDFLKGKSPQNNITKTTIIKSNNEEYAIFVNNESDLLNLIVPHRQNMDSVKDQ
ncbi:hypothetical protein [Helicobacter sp. MIT 14-3879]|uniref:hypothetical protein n=1 Tax=Helicobacter sp. MIT 14-3879 TaxID=2040649 RepID=UPI000E1F1300|nr:hypothetical protein [Helicobacter sp. MIT 14-3879]RDU65045.1 hypothetical protein CQA44_01675 [Helicobacter sp. MIT 14-3879]